jgi:anti-sigma regulatory factor (Ser/Thr protein kinase)
MEVSEGSLVSTYCVPVEDNSHTGEARRHATQLAASLGMNETEIGNVGLVVTEAAKNLLKHAGGGHLALRPLREQGSAGVEMLAIDKGPGIGNVARGFQDGYSTAGTPGTGLGAISRLSTLHDIYSQPSQGTALLAQIWNRAAGSVLDTAGFQVGAVSVAKSGEPVCGDAWGFLGHGRKDSCLIVADGLGHGLLAADAARAAVRTAEDHHGESGVPLMQSIHLALRPTRGAAVAFAEIDRDRKLLRYTGIGNIGGCILTPSGKVQHLVSHPGTAGHETHKMAEFQYPWQAGSLLILHSDGLTSHWSLKGYPGLMDRHPSLIAAVLFRDFNRGRDDVTVAAVRERTR